MVGFPMLILDVFQMNLVEPLKKITRCFIHYEKNRFMTPRELFKRLQSFDDNFIFEGSKSQILVQIGNAVPPKLGQNIASTLKEFF